MPIETVLTIISFVDPSNVTPFLTISEHVHEIAVDRLYHSIETYDMDEADMLHLLSAFKYDFMSSVMVSPNSGVI